METERNLALAGTMKSCDHHSFDLVKETGNLPNVRTWLGRVSPKFVA